LQSLWALLTEHLLFCDLRDGFHPSLVLNDALLFYVLPGALLFSDHFENLPFYDLHDDLISVIHEAHLDANLNAPLFSYLLDALFEHFQLQEQI